MAPKTPFFNFALSIEVKLYNQVNSRLGFVQRMLIALGVFDIDISKVMFLQ